MVKLFFKLIISIVIAIFVNILILQNDPWVKHQLTDSLKKNISKKINTNIDGTIEQINIFSGDIKACNVEIKSPDNSKKWLFNCSALKLKLSWVDLLSFKFIVNVSLDNAYMQTDFDDTSLYITSFINKLIKANNCLPISIKNTTISDLNIRLDHVNKPYTLKCNLSSRIDYNCNILNLYSYINQGTLSYKDLRYKKCKEHIIIGNMLGSIDSQFFFNISRDVYKLDDLKSNIDLNIIEDDKKNYQQCKLLADIKNSKSINKYIGKLRLYNKDKSLNANLSINESGIGSNKENNLYLDIKSSLDILKYNKKIFFKALGIDFGTLKNINFDKFNSIVDIKSSITIGNSIKNKTNLKFNNLSIDSHNLGDITIDSDICNSKVEFKAFNNSKYNINCFGSFNIKDYTGNLNIFNKSNIKLNILDKSALYIPETLHLKLNLLNNKDSYKAIINLYEKYNNKVLNLADLFIEHDDANEYNINGIYHNNIFKVEDNKKGNAKYTFSTKLSPDLIIKYLSIDCKLKNKNYNIINFKDNIGIVNYNNLSLTLNKLIKFYDLKDVNIPVFEHYFQFKASSLDLFNNKISILETCNNRYTLRADIIFNIMQKAVWINNFKFQSKNYDFSSLSIALKFNNNFKVDSVYAPILIDKFTFEYDKYISGLAQGAVVLKYKEDVLKPNLSIQSFCNINDVKISSSIPNDIYNIMLNAYKFCNSKIDISSYIKKIEKNVIDFYEGNVFDYINLPKIINNNIDNLNLNILINSSSPIKFKSELIDILVNNSVSIYTSDKIKGKKHIIAQGLVSSTNGILKLPYNKLFITKSDIDFCIKSNDIYKSIENIRFNIQAINTINNYKLRLSVNNILKKLNLSFDSNPKLSRSQIVNLLLTGIAKRSFYVSVPYMIAKSLYHTVSENAIVVKEKVFNSKLVSYILDLGKSFINKLYYRQRYNGKYVLS